MTTHDEVSAPSAQPVASQLALLDQWRRARPEQTALVSYDMRRSRETGQLVQRSRLSSTELWNEVLDAAVALRSIGVGPGDRVAIQLPNWKEYLVAHVAVCAIGATMIPISPILRLRDVQRQLDRGSAAALIVPASFGSYDFIEMAMELQRDGCTREVIAVGENLKPSAASVHIWARLLEAGRAATGTLRDEIATGAQATRPDAPLLVNFTSGTAGRPKGVMHSGRSVGSCVAPTLKRLQLKHDDVILVVPTLGHGAGILNGLFLPLALGATVVYLDAWNASIALDVIARERVSYAPVMPTYLFDIAAMPAASTVDLGCWKTGRVSGSAIPRDIMRAIQERLPALRLCPGWGMSETFWATCGSPDDPIDKRNGTDGRTVGDCRLEIRDASFTTGLPVGEVGEVVLKGSSLMLGYFEQPELTQSCYTADGWFKTGDLGRLDDEGYLIIKGRSKDLVIRGGENVPVVEVEELLMQHAKVLGVAVVGVPDERLGEKVCAVVELKKREDVLSFDEMRAFLELRHLTRHFVPEYLVVMDELPRTPVGKLMKQRIRDEVRGLLTSPAPDSTSTSPSNLS